MKSPTDPKQRTPLQRFSNGTRVDSNQLVALRDLASAVPLRRQRKVLNNQSGSHLSAIRGRGLEYSEVRHYQPGDDIRAMDWRVTARTGSPHIKVFQEEKERPLLLVCDLRAGMHFGTRRTFKQVLAADLCALLAWAGLLAGDRIGALLFNDEQEIDLRPKTGSKQVLQLINQLSQLPATPARDPQQRMTEICQHLHRIARPGTGIWFMSDWDGYDNSQQALLHDLTRHCDLTAIHLYDPLEAELPPPGTYDVSDGQRRQQLDSRDPQQRQRWHDEFEQRTRQLQQQLNAMRVPFISIATSDDPLLALRNGMGLN